MGESNIVYVMKFILLSLSFLCLLFTVLLDAQKHNKSGALHPCFCELNGQVDDCNCKVESVASFNNLKVYDRLQNLLTRNYFKFFKVNLDKKCPFWPDDGTCALESCAVCPCTDEQVPCGLKDEPGIPHGKEKYLKESKAGGDADGSCDSRSDEEIRLSALDTTISEESEAAFKTWTEHDDMAVDFCEVDDEQSLGMKYVDLTINPERYTGYKGQSAWRIWNSIYNENCFKPNEPANSEGYQTLLTDKSVRVSKYLKEMCLEKRVFYRLISGLHSSINVHLCAKYLLSGGIFGVETWGPNVDEFKQRFDPQTTDGEGPVRLKNLYFTYLVVLRAIAKAAPLLEAELFYTGEAKEDEQIQDDVEDLLQTIKQFPNHFNESTMFQGDKLQAKRLKEEFRNHFLNISRIMDCVGCDKCKLWGKLQIQGLGTALKILFSSPDSLKLRRREIIALFNGFGRLSSSVHEVREFQILLGGGTSGNAKMASSKSPFL
ncbi:ERO1-like protein beta isoform X2 [Acanthaster planci]|uniref:ERO1-like protein beta isoform X2 n=1 Tax=Acanthaster planci TaxID=133434 RepID=A0A8B7XSC4_ACAPL|nr:ERO1-like protein beta isoform X2 [Acanthaster planci]